MAMMIKRAVLILTMLLASCSGDDSGEPNQPDPGGDDGGMAGQGGSMSDAGGIVDLLRVPATVTAFSTLGEPRTGDDLTLSGDGFEYGERLCTANGLFCVTGGFGP